MELFSYQKTALDRVADHRNCAFYHDMGLGKTFTGAAKLMKDMDAVTSLVVCQKSKVQDWCDHFKENYPYIVVADLTQDEGWRLLESEHVAHVVCVINYDLIWRRPALFHMVNFSLMFDESSLLQNTGSKRTRAAMRLADKAHSLVLLSGTPVDGKYERLWSQLYMLGWHITERMFWRQYVETETTMVEGFPITKVLGYKNEERLARKMKAFGCDFLKTEDVLDLPEQRFVDVWCDRTKAYTKFARDNYVEVYWQKFVGDTTFGAMTAERMLAGAYSEEKLRAFEDLVAGTSDRVVVFYNFDVELEAMQGRLVKYERPMSVLNGKWHDLKAFRENGDGIVFVQYQAGAMGVNLQEAQYMVYFSPPLASSLFEQSKKRIHRVGQDKPCTYYVLKSKGTIEEKIYSTLAMRQDYTEKLFEMGR